MKISVVDIGKHILSTSNCSRVLTHSTNTLKSNISSYHTYDYPCNPRTEEPWHGVSVISRNNSAHEWSSHLVHRLWVLHFIWIVGFYVFEAVNIDYSLHVCCTV